MGRTHLKSEPPNSPSRAFWQTASNSALPADAVAGSRGLRHGEQGRMMQNAPKSY
jgi:hypothetical protein